MRAPGIPLHDSKADMPFEASFDARFPYSSVSAASSLIREGWAITLNAAFCVLEEICRPPRSAKVSTGRLQELAREWASGPDHPLKAPVFRAACTLIERASLPWQEGVALMKIVVGYDGQRAALNIVYFASDCDTPEGDDALERMRREIVERWEAAGS